MSRARRRPREIDGSLFNDRIESGVAERGLIERVDSRPDFYAVAESLVQPRLASTLARQTPREFLCGFGHGEPAGGDGPEPSRLCVVYYALHTFNFPVLIDGRGYDRTSVLLLMLVGIAFSATGAVLGFKRLRRTLAGELTHERPTLSAEARFSQRGNRTAVLVATPFPSKGCSASFQTTLVD